MPRYAVTVLVHINRTIIVEADDEDFALVRARMAATTEAARLYSPDDVALVDPIEAAPHAEMSI